MSDQQNNGETPNDNGFQLSPETQEKIDAVKEAAADMGEKVKAYVPEAQSRLEQAKYWAIDHKQQLIRAGLVAGAVVLVVRAKRRLSASDIPEPNVTLLVTPDQAARIHGLGKELLFESELGNFVLATAAKSKKG